MILPNKYISNTQSLFGLSALIISSLSRKELTIENLWRIFKKQYIDSYKLSSVPTYQKFLLTLDFMFMTGMINCTEDGAIYNENFKINN